MPARAFRTARRWKSTAAAASLDSCGHEGTAIMNAAAIAPLHARTARVFAFAYEVHPPATYLIVAASWSFSLMTLLQSSRGEIRLDPAAYLVGAIFFLILLYLRALDEIKDLEYDKLYNPSRPLVRGAVSVGEVWSLAALTAVVVLLL